MTKRAVVLSNPRAGNHDYGWRSGFAEGLRRRGWAVREVDAYQPADLVVKWGTRDRQVIATQAHFGGDLCILERGYLPCRMTYSSVSFGGGLNGRAVFRGPFDDSSRFDAHWKFEPWRVATGPAVVMGQVPGDMSLRNVNIGEWYGRVVRGLRANGWEVVFRPHPGARSRTMELAGVEILQGTLADALAAAGLVVTWNSNSGVDAVLAGVPTVAYDDGSMVRSVAGRDISDICFPDRSKWAARLAWCQYTLDEMKSGYCQEMVGL